MTTKICTKCGVEKDLELFVKRTNSPDGRAAECKDCHRAHSRERYRNNIEVNRERSRIHARMSYRRHKEKRKKYSQEYSKTHRERLTEKARVYRDKNREAVRERKRRYELANKDKKKQWDDAYRIKHADELSEKKKAYYLKNKERLSLYKKEYAKKNKEKLRAYKGAYYAEHADEIKAKAKEYAIKNKDINNAKMRQRIQTTPQLRIAHNLRTRIGAVLGGRSKGGRLHLLVGCDMNFLKKFLESHFKEGMRWDNYGKGIDKWSLDHYVPLEKFDLTNEDEQRKAFHYANMRPMWYSENASKSNRYIGEFRQHKSSP